MVVEIQIVAKLYFSKFDDSIVPSILTSVFIILLFY